MMAQAFLPELERQARERQGHGLTAPGQRSVSPDTERSGPPVRATAEAGRIVGVSQATVSRARRVAREDPELAERVKADGFAGLGVAPLLPPGRFASIGAGLRTDESPA